MLIVTSSDIHAPLRLKDFEVSLVNIEEEPDYILLAGDIIDKNQHFYLKKVYTIIRSFFPNSKIYSVFGNNEYIEYRNMYKKEYEFMNWIDDSYVDLGDYYLIGTEGILDLPTPWMRKNIPNILELWRIRFKSIERLLKTLDDKPIIFLSHYAPTCKTVFGDPAPASVLCSRKMENLLLKCSNIRVIIHGHAHNAKIWNAKIDNAEAINVSFYIHNKPLIINL
ncbi:MAG TPA: hypothetical protein EYH22_00285 [Candidatus Nanopusillus sp.]|nr:hypothetical protein [Candidatus Nanopusillus sp.]